MKLPVLALVALVALATAGSASTISYDEGISGDAGHGVATAQNLGSLSGLGDVLEVRGGTVEAAGDSRDVYSFSSTVTFNVIIDSFDVTERSSNWGLYRDDGSFERSSDLVAEAAVRTDDVGLLFGQIAAGDYFMWVFESSTDVVANYDFSIAAAAAPLRAVSASSQDPLPPVPLPAGLPLMVGGIGALAWLRRRTKLKRP